MTLTTLKKRREFLRIRGGRRCAAPAFVLEGKPRPAPGSPASPGSAVSTEKSASGAQARTTALAGLEPHVPRFGFTITKKVGHAVERNRMRRRLKAAIQVAAPLADPRFDYVIIARRAALDRPYDQLVTEFSSAFKRIHSEQHSKQSGAHSKPAARHHRNTQSSGSQTPSSSDST